jgi:hypothetical protein
MLQRSPVTTAGYIGNNGDNPGGDVTDVTVVTRLGV